MDSGHPGVPKHFPVWSNRLELWVLLRKIMIRGLFHNPISKSAQLWDANAVCFPVEELQTAYVILCLVVNFLLLPLLPLDYCRGW